MFRLWIFLTVLLFAFLVSAVKADARSCEPDQTHFNWAAKFTQPHDPFYSMQVNLKLLRENLNLRSLYAAKILNKELGKVRSINCFELEHWSRHHKLQNLLRQPTEFIVDVYSRGEQEKVLFTSSAPNPYGIISAGQSEENSNKAYELVRDGWVHSLSLHNHPFNPENVYGDYGGTIIPSAPDIVRAFDYQTQVIVVTNGIFSLELNREEIEEAYNLCIASPSDCSFLK